MNTSLNKFDFNLKLFLKKGKSSKFIDKIKSGKMKHLSSSVERDKNSDNRNKTSSNTLIKKRTNKSIDRISTSSITKKVNRNNIYSSGENEKNYLYENLTSSLPFYSINYKDLKYNLNDIIYYGKECILYRGKYFHNDICIKEIVNINSLPEDELDKIKNEIYISLKLHHKNIVNTFGYSFNDKRNKFYIISEYMKNRSLKLYIETNKGNIPLKQKLLFIYEISLAIEYMHTRNQQFLHRDIKSSNVILDDNLHCKLCDFGMSKYYYNNNSNQNDDNTRNMNINYQTNSQSTLFWMSPEYLCDGIINEKCDIYSFGILIWEIFMEDTSPYKNININDYLLGNKDVVYYKRPIINEENFKDCPDIKELMKQMWDQDYNKRPDIGHILDVLEDLNNQNPFL
jgi:tRNA A-37 threonylcarbamoyl transferase component Bud32